MTDGGAAPALSEHGSTPYQSVCPRIYSLSSRFNRIAVPGLTATAPSYPYGRANPGGPGGAHESEEERMDITRIEASVDTHTAAFDTLARSLHARLPRRRVAGLLATALTTGVFGISTHSKTAEAKRKRGKRRSSRRGGAAAERATSIPPNCIYVCCDGTCDSWKMCMRCVKWPKPTTTTTIAAG